MRIQYGDGFEISKNGHNKHMECLFDCVSAAGGPNLRGTQLVFITNAPYALNEMYNLKLYDGTTLNAIVGSIAFAPVVNCNRVEFIVI